MLRGHIVILYLHLFLSVCLSHEMLTFFPTRQWDDQMLSDACRLVLDEIYIPPAAKGGMVEYRRTLIISLLFKFYLRVRQGLNKMVTDLSGSLGVPWHGRHESAQEGPPQHLEGVGCRALRASFPGSSSFLLALRVSLLPHFPYS